MSGRHEDFKKYALVLLKPFLERFKAKKQIIVDAMREACDAIYPSTSLKAVRALILEMLCNKSPWVRQQAALFLAKCFAMTEQASFATNILHAYLPPLLKNLRHSYASVREASAKAVGALYKIFDETIILHLSMKSSDDIPKAMIEKIKKYGQECASLNAKGEPRATQAAGQVPMTLSNTG
jgi:cytoskeleton-associated protein 5